MEPLAWLSAVACGRMGRGYDGEVASSAWDVADSSIGRLENREKQRF